MKKITKIIMTIVALFSTCMCCNVVSFFLGIPIRIDKIYNPELSSFAEQLESISFPPESTRISDMMMEFGLFGNGNHCDYHAGYLLKSEKSLSELQEYYGNYKLDLAFPLWKASASVYEDIIPVQVSQPWGKQWISQEYYYASASVNDINQVSKERKSRYAEKYKVSIDALSDDVFLVEAYDIGYPASYWVCH